MELRTLNKNPHEKGFSSSSWVLELPCFQLSHSKWLYCPPRPSAPFTQSKRSIPNPWNQNSMNKKKRIWNPNKTCTKLTWELSQPRKVSLAFCKIRRIWNNRLWSSKTGNFIQRLELSSFETRTHAVGRLNETVAAMSRCFGTRGRILEDWSNWVLVPSHGRGRLCSLRDRTRCDGYGSGLPPLQDCENGADVVVGSFERIWPAMFGKKTTSEVSYASDNG